ncbi:MAG TPA: glycosyltransferase family 2 protein, partial [Myxococcota bacterium]
VPVVATPARTATLLALFVLVVLGALSALVWWACEVAPSTMQSSDMLGTSHALLGIAVFFVGYDIALGCVLLRALVLAFRARSSATTNELTHDAPAVSVLIAAWNEVDVIADTVRRWTAQDGVVHEVLIGDDGSTDDTFAELVRALSLASDGARASGTVHGCAVRAFRFGHAGKGATLNALAQHAAHGVLVTVDADTTPAPAALALVAQAFTDDNVDVATGVVSIRNGRRNWMLANQSAEYLKNAWVRIAWSALGGLEQVPGAFAAMRAPMFAEVGGFPLDSLTEDYELTFRFIAHGAVRGRPLVVVTVPGAQVFTDGPASVRGFIRQRTRWFAGFLTTLFKFRALLFRRAPGCYGVLRLPLKLVDAALPAIAFASFAVLLRAGFDAALGLMAASVALFGVRWLWDLFVYACATRASHRLGAPSLSEAAAPPAAIGWLLTALEALTFVWFKHAAAVRGMWWAARRARTWEASRLPASASTSDAPASRTS